MVSRLFMRNVVDLGSKRSADFTILVPVYGSPSYFKNREFLEQYKDNTLLALGMSNEEMRSFADEMEQDGWRVWRIESERSYSVVKMLRSAAEQVSTGYVIRLDADTTTNEDLFRVVADVERAGADLCSVRVHVENTDSLVEAMQALEYRMAMLGRRIRPWLTSGACMVAQTSSFRKILDNHSTYFPGEDVEIGRTAKHFRMRVMHHPAEVLTVAPDSWRALVRQRRLWWSGSFRHSIVNLDHNARFPLWSLYTAGTIWVLWFAKVSISMESLAFLPIVMCFYMLLTFVANWEVRSPLMLLFPLYSLFQVIVMPVLGVVSYVQTSRRLRLWGRYRFGVLRPRKLLS